MTLVLVVLAGAILVAIVGAVAWGGASRRRAANDYEHAMDTLARMTGRPSSSATGRGWMGQPPESTGQRAAPIAPPPTGPAPPGAPLTAIRSAAGKNRPVSWMRPASVEPGRRGSGRGVARFARLAGAGVGLIVLVVLTVTVVSLAVGGSSHSPSGRQNQATGGGAGRSSTLTTRAVPRTTTPSNQLTALSSDANGATYNSPTSGPYTLSFSTTGPCWLRVTLADGTVMLEETLPGAATRSLKVPGPAEVRVGNAANVTVQVDGKPVVVPETAALPYNLTFQAA